MTLDIEAAKQAGANDNQIMKELASIHEFDLEGAKKAGARDNQIYDELKRINSENTGEILSQKDANKFTPRIKKMNELYEKTMLPLNYPAEPLPETPNTDIVTDIVGGMVIRDKTPVKPPVEPIADFESVRGPLAPIFNVSKTVDNAKNTLVKYGTNLAEVAKNISSQADLSGAVIQSVVKMGSIIPATVAGTMGAAYNFLKTGNPDQLDEYSRISTALKHGAEEHLSKLPGGELSKVIDVVASFYVNMVTNIVENTADIKEEPVTEMDKWKKQFFGLATDAIFSVALVKGGIKTIKGLKSNSSITNLRLNEIDKLLDTVDDQGNIINSVDNIAKANKMLKELADKNPDIAKSLEENITNTLEDTQSKMEKKLTKKQQAKATAEEQALQEQKLKDEQIIKDEQLAKDKINYNPSLNRFWNTSLREKAEMLSKESSEKLIQDKAYQRYLDEINNVLDKRSGYEKQVADVDMKIDEIKKLGEESGYYKERERLNNEKLELEKKIEDGKTHAEYLSDEMKIIEQDITGKEGAKFQAEELAKVEEEKFSQTDPQVKPEELSQEVKPEEMLAQKESIQPEFELKEDIQKKINPSAKEILNEVDTIADKEVITPEDYNFMRDNKNHLDFNPANKKIINDLIKEYEVKNDIKPIEKIIHKKTLSELIREKAKGNTIITDEMKNKAIEDLLKTDMNTLSMGPGKITADTLKNISIIAAHFIESGFRDFAAFSSVMIEKFSEEIKPHLDKIWNDALENLNKNLEKHENELVKDSPEGKKKLGFFRKHEARQRAFFDNIIASGDKALIEIAGEAGKQIADTTVRGEFFKNIETRLNKYKVSKMFKGINTEGLYQVFDILGKVKSVEDIQILKGYNPKIIKAAIKYKTLMLDYMERIRESGIKDINGKPIEEIESYVTHILKDEHIPQEIKSRIGSILDGEIVESATNRGEDVFRVFDKKKIPLSNYTKKRTSNFEGDVWEKDMRKVANAYIDIMETVLHDTPILQKSRKIIKGMKDGYAKNFAEDYVSSYAEVASWGNAYLRALDSKLASIGASSVIPLNVGIQIYHVARIALQGMPELGTFSVLGSMTKMLNPVYGNKIHNMVREMGLLQSSNTPFSMKTLSSKIQTVGSFYDIGNSIAKDVIFENVFSKESKKWMKENPGEILKGDALREIQITSAIETARVEGVITPATKSVLLKNLPVNVAQFKNWIQKFTELALNPYVEMFKPDRTIKQRVQSLFKFSKYIAIGYALNETSKETGLSLFHLSTSAIQLGSPVMKTLYDVGKNITKEEYSKALGESLFLLIPAGNSIKSQLDKGFIFKEKHSSNFLHPQELYAEIKKLSDEDIKQMIT